MIRTLKSSDHQREHGVLSAHTTTDPHDPPQESARAI